jgi:drug/metabolite transporter (DMT)-like permease
MLTGGAILLVAGAALGERLDVAGVTASAWLAWAYLSMVVTLGAFSAYAFALASLPVSTVATYAYVNPVIAVALGWFVVGERLTIFQLAGAAVVLVAVVLVVSAERPSRKRPSGNCQSGVAASPV